MDTGDANDKYVPFLEAVLRGNLRIDDANESQGVCIGITDMYVTLWDTNYQNHDTLAP